MQDCIKQIASAMWMLAGVRTKPGSVDHRNCRAPCGVEKLTQSNVLYWCMASAKSSPVQFNEWWLVGFVIVLRRSTALPRVGDWIHLCAMEWHWELIVDIKWEAYTGTQQNTPQVSVRPSVNNINALSQNTLTINLPQTWSTTCQWPLQTL